MYVSLWWYINVLDMCWIWHDPVRAQSASVCDKSHHWRVLFGHLWGCANGGLSGRSGGGSGSAEPASAPPPRAHNQLRGMGNGCLVHLSANGQAVLRLTSLELDFSFMLCSFANIWKDLTCIEVNAYFSWCSADRDPCGKGWEPDGIW